MERILEVPALDKISSPKLDAIVGEMGCLGLDHAILTKPPVTQDGFFCVRRGSI
jgi:hypothetical protein